MPTGYAPPVLGGLTAITLWNQGTTHTPSGMTLCTPLTLPLGAVFILIGVSYGAFSVTNTASVRIGVSGDENAYVLDKQFASASSSFVPLDGTLANASGRALLHGGTDGLLAVVETDGTGTIDGGGVTVWGYSVRLPDNTPETWEEFV